MTSSLYHLDDFEAWLALDTDPALIAGNLDYW